MSGKRRSTGYLLRTRLCVLVFVATTIHIGQEALCQNSTSWVATSLSERNIVGVVATSDGHLFAAAIDVGVFHSIDGGDGWRQTWAVPESDWITSLAMGRDGLLLVGTRHTGVFSSTDKGETWVALLPGGTTHVQPYVAEQREHLVALSDVVMVSSDGGQSWESTPVVADDGYEFTAFSSDSSGTLFLGSTGPSMEPVLGNIYLLHDWSEPATRIGSLGAYKTILASDDGSVFSGGFFGVAYAPSTQPAKWEWTLRGVTEDLVRLTRDTLYAATTSGVFFTENRGQNWTAVLPDVSAYSLGLGPDGTLYAGTSTGVFKTDSPIRTSVRGLDMPDGRASDAASFFPNPAGHSATLSRSGLEAGWARVLVVDVLGREVGLTARLPPDQHSISLDTGKLAPGVYFARVVFDDPTRLEVIPFVKE